VQNADQADDDGDGRGNACDQNGLPDFGVAVPPDATN